MAWPPDVLCPSPRASKGILRHFSPERLVTGPCLSVCPCLFPGIPGGEGGGVEREEQLVGYRE